MLRRASRPCARSARSSSSSGSTPSARAGLLPSWMGASGRTVRPMVSTRSEQSAIDPAIARNSGESLAASARRRRRTPAASRAAGVCRAGRSGAPHLHHQPLQFPDSLQNFIRPLARGGIAEKVFHRVMTTPYFLKIEQREKESSCGAAAPPIGVEV